MKHFFYIYLLSLFIYSCGKENNSHPKKTDANQVLDQAYIFLDDKKNDSAFFYFNKAKSDLVKNNQTLLAANCLLNMAIIANDQADYFSGQELALEALTLLNIHDKNHFPYLQSTYNTLGISSDNLKNHQEAIQFYKNSLKYANDSTYKQVTENNIANVYREKKDYKLAIRTYKKALSQLSANPKEYARVFSNLAYAKWKENPKHPIRNELIKALNIRIKEDDLRGQASSYAHLTDFYEYTQPDSALYYANKRYQITQLINSPDDEIEVLKKLISLAPEKNSKLYFEPLQQLSDSLQTARSNAKNQFALIRYETEKHKADNLMLQKQNTERKYQIIILLAAAILTSTIGWLWYRKRKHALKLENERNIKENQLKTSKKVHDVVANGLYRVMSEIENKEALNKELLLDQIEELYEKSRDISYEEVAQTTNFQERITNLLTAFASDKTKVILINNTKSIWLSIAEKTKHELEQILQELMVNMKKHSYATNVVIKFEQTNAETNIYYADNGIGLSKEEKFKNGLTNTGNRIKNISGKITFDTGLEQGLKIRISFPTP
ncbi:ATP-binding protein [Pedobacter sp. UBA4863]|uniref:tetratricopeptide repeat-containing sensor histidine kinase n=1 Tax=Pedobacter sp. UBA4863 TaxID=1947060 RepID=UPI0025F78EC1|nr:ATP-binding protein [Pedobacter sp. UBA4863]